MRIRKTKLSLALPELSDVYHQMLQSSWTRFLSGVLALYFGINFLFAVVYFGLGPEGISGLHHTEGLVFFVECYFFSIQTFSTIGYGGLHPVGVWHNLVVSIQAFCGMLSIGLVSGIIYARFSRPIPKVVFSKNFLITNNLGERQLILRVANARKSQIVDATVSLYLLQDVLTPEGNYIYHLTDIQPRRARTPIFFLSWMIMHTIDDKSPLKNFDISEAAKKNFQLLVTIQGQDSVFFQGVHARHSYTAEDCVFDRHYVDIVKRSGTGSSVDIDKISELKPHPQKS